VKERNRFSLILLVVLSVVALHRQGYSDAQSIDAPGPEKPETSGLAGPVNPAFMDCIKVPIRESGSDKEESLSPLIPSPIPPEKHVANVQLEAVSDSSSSYDTRYDMRDPNGDGDQADSLLPDVRNQGSHYGCWVFGVYSSLESHIKKTFGVEEDLSENHLQHAHGFDFGASGGGSISAAAAYLSRYEGPISEADDPYYSADYCTDCSPVRYIDNIIELPVRSDVHDNDYIKQAVLDYGGVFTSMLFEFKDASYNSDTYTYYCEKTPDEDPADNHGVAIIGWDDNKVVPGAPGDGAFIVRNSWGAGWGEDGYFYVSYFDKRIAFSMVTYFDEKDDADLEFNKVFYYDKFGLTNTHGFGDEGAWAANWFVPGEDGRLRAVGFFATHSNMSYEIRIYDQRLGPIFIGEPIHTQTGELAHRGWHTVELDQEVAMKKNNDFGVAVGFQTPGYNDPLPIEAPIENYSSKATANPGESYVSTNGVLWTDLTQLHDTANVCIKAYWTESRAIDHTCTDLLQISDGLIDKIQTHFKLHYAHTSHGDQLVTGLERIAQSNSKCDVAVGTSSLAEQEGALCIFDGQEHDTYITPDEYWASEQGRQYTQDVLSHNPLINLSMWSWCSELDEYSEQDVQAYLDQMAVFEEANPGVTFVYMTANAQATGEAGYNRYLRNNQIRSWVKDHPEKNRGLFDFADLDSWWRDPDSCDWEQETYEYCGNGECIDVPVEHPRFHGDESGHTTHESCEQKGKAVWWMLAKLAGFAPPVADAGTNGAVDEGTEVTLSGLGSFQAEGGIASFHWAQTAGPTVALSEPEAARCPFTAPEVGPDGASLTFQLTVTDDEGLHATDHVIIQVSDKVIPGDINSSQTVDLADAIMALQLCSGMTPSSTVDLRADVSGDGKIGLEEGVYILQKCVDLR
jgi:C1A family cysteine protease